MNPPDKFKKDVDKAVQWAEGQVATIEKPRHPGGRPQKYGPQMIEIAQDYLEKYTQYGDKVPSIQGLAIRLGVRRETVQVWAHHEEKEELSNILNQIKNQQHQDLVNNGLSGDFNSVITKLMLTKHGYHDKVDNRVESFNINIDGKDAGCL